MPTCEPVTLGAEVDDNVKVVPGELVQLNAELLPSSPTGAPSPQPVLPVEDLLLVEEVSAQARAPNTARAYASDWAAFTQWCVSRPGYGETWSDLPCPPSMVAAYLIAQFRDGKALATLERRLTSISFHHTQAGYDGRVLRAAREVRDTMKALRREAAQAVADGAPPRGRGKVAPLLLGQVEAALATIGQDMKGIRDRAMVLLGWATAQRRSELVATRAEHLEFAEEGFRLTIPRSKTDQEGQGAVLGVPFWKDSPLCPVTAVKAWMAASGVRDGYLFRRLVGAGITDQPPSPAYVARLIRRLVAGLGLTGRYAGHSLRCGFLTEGAAHAVPLEDLMRQSRHRSHRVAMGYVRHASVFTRNPAAEVFKGWTGDR